MRALFKQLMKGSGTPVLQTCDARGETILSAGNIWTSAHARRNALREEGLVPGDVLCGERGGFDSVIDFVACTIGGFVYLPLESQGLAALRAQLARGQCSGREGIVLVDQRGAHEHFRCGLPALLDPLRDSPGALLALAGAGPEGHRPRLAIMTGPGIERQLVALADALGTPIGGTRLSWRGAHRDAGFIADLLLGLFARQTIYLRCPGRGFAPQAMIEEALDLSVDDLVITPAMIEPVARAALTLEPGARRALAAIRLHTGSQRLTASEASLLALVFEQVFIESVALEFAAPMSVAHSA